MVNAIPDSCTFECNFRFALQDQKKQIDQTVQKIAETNRIEGCTCSVEQFSYRPPMELVQANVDLLNKINQIFNQYGLSPFHGIFHLGGSDAAYTTLAGIPTADNLGIQGDGIHSINEFAFLSSLEDTALRLATINYEF